MNEKDMKLQLENTFFSLLSFELGTPLSDAIKNSINEKLITALFRLSKQHDLAHLIGDALDKNELLPEASDVRKFFLRERNKAIYRYEQQRYELEQICKVLEDVEISFLPLKGSVLREYYPEPWMRTSCDIDILVPKERCALAVQKLIEGLGYKEVEKSAHDIGLVSSNGVHLELHYSLMETDEKFQKVLSSVWERVKRVKGYHFCMTDEMFYFHHIAHMAKHFKAGGCGMRSILDWWILEKRKVHDDNKLKMLLGEGGLLRFSEKLSEFAQYCFGGRAMDESITYIKDYILYAGMYGDVKNRAAINQIKRGGRWRYLLSRVFIPVRELKHHFPVLEKHIWLMPFCQIGRWFKLAFGRKSETVKRELKANMDIRDLRKECIAKLLKDLDL